MPSISLPALRQIGGSSSTYTVPSGQTWIVRHIASSASVGVCNVTINGTSMTLQKTYSASSSGWNQLAIDPWGEGHFIDRSIILKAGDSITTAGGWTIFYWILEQDFNIQYTIPTLRYATYTKSTVGDTTILTVPAGEHWAIHLGRYSFTGTPSASAIIGIKLNSFYKFGIQGSGSAGSISGATGKFILKPGDQIHMSNWTGTGPQTLSFFYWILEQDF